MACPHWRGKSRAGCGRSWPPHRGAREGGAATGGGRALLPAVGCGALCITSIIHRVPGGRGHAPVRGRGRSRPSGQAPTPAPGAAAWRGRLAPPPLASSVLGGSSPADGALRPPRPDEASERPRLRVADAVLLPFGQGFRRARSLIHEHSRTFLKIRASRGPPALCGQAATSSGRPPASHARKGWGRHPSAAGVREGRPGRATRIGGRGRADPGRAASLGMRTGTSLFSALRPSSPGHRGSAEGHALRSKRTGSVLNPRSFRRPPDIPEMGKSRNSGKPHRLSGSGTGVWDEAAGPRACVAGAAAALRDGRSLSHHRKWAHLLRP